MLNGAWPLTLSQQDIYLDALSARCGARYNVGGYIQLGNIDPHRLADSHARLVALHEIFGLRIVPYDGGVVQTIATDRDAGLPLIDFSSRDDPESSASAWLDELFGKPLEMEEAELFEAYLVRLGTDRYWYVGIAHHIAVDGWGFSNWARELARLYSSDGPATSAEAWQTAAIDEQAYLQGSRYKRDRTYWREQFPKRPRATFTRKACEGSGVASSGRVTKSLSVEESELLGSLSASANASPSHVLLAALLCCFGRYSRTEPVCIGLPFHNRKNAVQKEMLGVFVGVNLLQLKIDMAESCIQLVQRVGSKQREALRHRQYPIGHLVRHLELRSENKRLYDVGFNYLRFENDLDFGGQPATLHYVPNRNSSTPMMLTAWESTRAEPLQLHLDFSHEYFSDQDGERALRRIHQVLRQIVSQPGRAVGEVPMLLEGERDLLTGLSSQLRFDGGRESILSRLQRRISLRPDAIAASIAGRTMTFRQLGSMIEVAAERIRECAEGAPARIAVCLPRGFAMVAVLFGIWRTGATVMLLDPADDAERTEFMLDRGAVQLLVTDPALLPRFLHTGIPAALIGPDMVDAGNFGGSREIFPAVPAGSNVAALTWAQDGTEPPRLAEVSHPMLECLVQWAGAEYSEFELSRVLAITPLSDSASLFEWVVPLCLGHSIVIGRETATARRESSGATLIHVDAAVLRRMLAEDEIPPSVVAVCIHGRAPPQKLIDELSRRNPNVHHLVQTAGGAEHCYCAIVSSQSCRPGATSPTRQHRLLDCIVLTQEGDIAPIDWLGELHVTEPFRVTPSRKQRTEQGEHRPVDTNSWRSTGLLARNMPDGRIEIAASAGNLVRANGYLLNLDEIERHTEMLADVDAAVASVITTPNGDELVLRVSGARKSGTGFASGKRWLDGIREQIGAHLPSYMVPGRIDVIDGRHPVSDAVTLGTHATTTDLELETWLVHEWADISELPVEDIDPASRFLANCASIHALIRFAHRLSMRWQVDMTPADLVDESSLRSLANSVHALLALRKMVAVATETTVNVTNQSDRLRS